MNYSLARIVTLFTLHYIIVNYMEAIPINMDGGRCRLSMFMVMLGDNIDHENA